MIASASSFNPDVTKLLVMASLDHARHARLELPGARARHHPRRRRLCMTEQRACLKQSSMAAGSGVDGLSAAADSAKSIAVRKSLPHTTPTLSRKSGEG